MMPGACKPGEDGMPLRHAFLVVEPVVERVAAAFVLQRQPRQGGLVAPEGRRAEEEHGCAPLQALQRARPSLRDPVRPRPVCRPAPDRPVRPAHTGGSEAVRPSQASAFPSIPTATASPCKPRQGGGSETWNTSRPPVGAPPCSRVAAKVYSPAGPSSVSVSRRTGTASGVGSGTVTVTASPRPRPAGRGCGSGRILARLEHVFVGQHRLDGERRARCSRAGGRRTGTSAAATSRRHRVEGARLPLAPEGPQPSPVMPWSSMPVRL